MATDLKLGTLDVLGEEHVQVREALSDLKDALQRIESNPPYALAIIRKVTAFLKKDALTHFRVEEEALFPVLGRVIGFDGPIAVMQAEHKYLLDRFSSLEDMVAKQPTESKKLAAICQDIVENLTAHSTKEDDILFPMARRVLDEKQLSEIDEKARLICPHVH